ncbi:hypothetical protein KKF25_00185, partial [Patescibacteria group bacterium]|nr:hypothetical protein [Patescibacteria group bacterium]
LFSLWNLLPPFGKGGAEVDLNSSSPRLRESEAGPPPFTKREVGPYPLRRRRENLKKRDAVPYGRASRVDWQKFMLVLFLRLLVWPELFLVRLFVD